MPQPAGRRKKMSIDEPGMDRPIDEPVYGSCAPNFEKVSAATPFLESPDVS